MNVNSSAPMESLVAVAQGVKLFVKVLGAGPTVVIPLACWCEEFDVLATKRRIVLYDPRGRGLSSPVELEQVSFQSDLDDLGRIQAWLDDPQIALVGWSYFGGVVARYAMDYPERVSRLVFVGGMPVRGGDFLERVQSEQASRLRNTAPALMEALAGGTTSPEALRELWDAFVATRSGRKPPWPDMRSNPFQYPNEQPERFFPLANRAMQTIGDYDWRKDAGRLRMPVLVIEGSEDLLPHEAISEWMEALPNGRSLILDGVGHFPSLEDPARFFPVLDEFL